MINTFYDLQLARDPIPSGQMLIWLSLFLSKPQQSDLAWSHSPWETPAMRRTPWVPPARQQPGMHTEPWGNEPRSKLHSLSPKRFTAWSGTDNCLGSFRWKREESNRYRITEHFVYLCIHCAFNRLWWSWGEKSPPLFPAYISQWLWEWIIFSACVSINLWSPLLQDVSIYNLLQSFRVAVG